MNKYVLLLGFCISITGIASHELQAQDTALFDLVGFATVGAGTSGGAGGDVIRVSTGTELQNALKAKQDSPTPLVILVEGTINLDNSPGLSKIDVKDVSDVSIIGTAPYAEFDGIGLKLRRASNIIIQNLMIHHVLSGEKDCIGIEGPADHIWVDHCELYNEFQNVDKDYYDGLLDAKADAEYLTYSWNFLHDSWKTALVGRSESDIHDRKLTMHHNYFLNCNSRVPLFRASTGHFFNNYFKDIASTVINTRINSCVRIENNYFENARNPWVSAYSDVLGGGDTIGNILLNSPFVYSSDTHPIESCTPDIPYGYGSVLHDASDVPGLVTAFAGVGKIDTGGDPVHVFSKEISLRIHPNPLSEASLIILPNGEAAIDVELYDLSGRAVQVTWERTDEGIVLNRSGLSSGIYMLRINTGRFYSGRIIIK
jgi:pectate lyase